MSPFLKTCLIENQYTKKLSPEPPAPLWVVDPDRREIDVYEPNKDKRTLTESDTLDGDEVMKGFRLRLGDIFPPK